MRATEAAVVPLVWCILMTVGCWGRAGVEQPIQSEFDVLGSSSIDQREVGQARVSGNGVVLTGVLRAPDPCQQLRSDVRVRDSRIRVQVISSDRKDVVCSQVIAYFEYRVRLSEIPAGQYNLELVHVWEGVGWEPVTVYEKTVTLP